MTTVTDIGNALDILAEILERWESRLRNMTDDLGGARYAAETDEALNLEAQLQSRIAAVLDDEMGPMVETLRELSAQVEAEAPKPN